MAEESYEDRNEPATPKKREKARQEGKVARSQEVSASLILMAGLLLLSVWGPHFIGNMRGLIWMLQGNATDFTLTTESFYPQFIAFLKFFAVLILPMAIPLAVVAIGSNVMQVGFLVTAKPLEPKLDSLNPVNGIKRIFSAKGLFELGKSLIKIAIIASIAYLTIRGRFEDLVGLAGTTTTEFLKTVGEVGLELGLRTALALCILAIIDYAFQRWQFEKSIRMSKKELTDEFKQSEGDPHVKSKVRSLMRQMSRNRMLSDTADADVVVTNPIHVAVALRYDPERDSAPVVVAKGMRRLAEKIKEIARTNDVAIVENPPLARQLHRVVEVGDAIPMSLYKAVAEVLAFVYRLKRQRVGNPASVEA